MNRPPASHSVHANPVDAPPAATPPPRPLAVDPPPAPDGPARKFRASVLLPLLRVKLSLAVSFSALAGYLLAARERGLSALAVFVGVFLLSGGASAFNQIEERKRDALMARTSGRPLPTGRVSPVAALIAAAGLAAAGFLVLFAGAGPVAALLGAVNLAWYNLVYTPLKTKTRFALFAGALTGAIPVAIGWAGAGGALGSPALLAVALFMYLWQIPHFLLLALTYGEEYERAGFRCFLTRAPERRGRSAVLAWTILAVGSTALFPLFSAVAVIPLTVAVFTAGAGTTAIFAFAALYPEKIPLSFASRSLYAYQLVVLVCLIVQGLAA